MESDPSKKDFVDYMIQRKRTLFSDDQRLIGQFELFYNDGNSACGQNRMIPARRPRILWPLRGLGML